MDSNGDTPGKALYGSMFYSGAPLLSEDRQKLLEYIQCFVSLHDIEYIIPGTDDFVNFLRECEEEFPEARVITSPLETCIISRSKKLTYNSLRDIVRVPKVFSIEDVDQYPVFIKPNRGTASRDCKTIDTMEELEHCYDRQRDIICEYLPGHEFTVDCLTDADGELLYQCPRRRTMKLAGISILTSGVTENDILDEVEDIAFNINTRIEFTGAWFFQVKYACDGSLCLLKIAPRISGAMVFSRISGVNLPLLSLNIFAGLPVRVDGYRNPVCTMKMYKTYISPPLEFKNLYVDLDDTLVIKGKVNPEAMGCLYRKKGQGVLIHLVTRRCTNIEEYLKRFHIPESIFTSRRQIFDLAPKSQFMVPNSVFVDDSSKERSECFYSGKNILCFDVDAFNFL